MMLLARLATGCAALGLRLALAALLALAPVGHVLAMPWSVAPSAPAGMDCHHASDDTPSRDTCCHHPGSDCHCAAASVALPTPETFRPNRAAGMRPLASPVFALDLAVVPDTPPPRA